MAAQQGGMDEPMTVPWRRSTGRESRYSHVESDSTHAAYRRNLIILLVTGIGIALALLSGRTCGAGKPVRTAPRDTASIELANTLAREWPDFLFDVSAGGGQNRSTSTITVISDSGFLPPADFIPALEQKTVEVLGVASEGALVIRIQRRDANGRLFTLLQHRTTLARIRARIGATGNR